MGHTGQPHDVRASITGGRAGVGSSAPRSFASSDGAKDRRHQPASAQVALLELSQEGAGPHGRWLLPRRVRLVESDREIGRREERKRTRSWIANMKRELGQKTSRERRFDLFLRSIAAGTTG